MHNLIPKSCDIILCNGQIYFRANWTLTSHEVPSCLLSMMSLIPSYFSGYDWIIWLLTVADLISILVWSQSGHLLLCLIHNLSSFFCSCLDSVLHIPSSTTSNAKRPAGRIDNSFQDVGGWCYSREKTDSAFWSISCSIRKEVVPPQLTITEFVQFVTSSRNKQTFFTIRTW